MFSDCKIPIYDHDPDSISISINIFFGNKNGSFLHFPTKSVNRALQTRTFNCPSLRSFYSTNHPPLRTCPKDRYRHHDYASANIAPQAPK